ncbi:hypothetical protein Acsp03_70890 [Actinomadura sp. NBRC 104412]|uniref:hypothetical protein n=1 Tax=Actinomadura sp. NBRC 104412 TaxID=3032203 RepID=UPI0024A0F914|nr:hypothetical protein [Actinomadura sp. NBRC 104412]GLZ09623.1 hypothetical protein Acsp03_70890 [Actinomadura sp. NBRC 104412]
MRLIRLRGQCDDPKCDPKPTCPTLYLTDRATLIVQGWIVTEEPGLTTAGALVEVPLSLLWESPTPLPPENQAFTLTGRGTAIVRGRRVTDTEVLDRLALPEGESAVEVSLSLLPEVVPSAR